LFVLAPFPDDSDDPNSEEFFFPSFPLPFLDAVGPGIGPFPSDFFFICVLLF